MYLPYFILTLNYVDVVKGAIYMYINAFSPQHFSLFFS